MKTHIEIARTGNLYWLGCRTSINTELDTIELASILDCGIPPALDCATCIKWIQAECRRRGTKLPMWFCG